MSLVDHNYQYKIFPDNFAANALTVSGVSYSKRHFEMVKKSDNYGAAKHITLGIIELLPVIGAIVAIFERFIASILQLKPTPIPPCDTETDASDESNVDEEKFISQFDEKDPDNNGLPLANPPNALNLLEVSFIDLTSSEVKDLDKLLTYHDPGNREPTIELNSVLTEQNWNDLLDANDLSYAVAKTHTAGVKKQQKVDRQLAYITNKLSENGWNDYYILIGKTGRGNIEDDASCVVLVNKEKNLIYVAFHGSRNGSKINRYNPSGDWGANWDSDLVSAKDKGLYGAPEDVKFHQGFGDNFISVQNDLLQKLTELIPTLQPNPHIIITGHSKGGAEVNIAAPVVTQYLRDNHIKAKVGAVTLAAPMCFNKAGANWVLEVVNIKNIFRLKVYGDPVTYGSFKGQDYAHVGIRLRENVDKVRKRTAEWHKNHGRELGRFESYLNYHYAAERDGSYCFVPETVMRHSELMEAFEDWKDSLYKAGHNLFQINGFIPEHQLQEVENNEKNSQNKDKEELY